jgi:hypothetical protein
MMDRFYKRMLFRKLIANFASAIRAAIVDEDDLQFDVPCHTCGANYRTHRSADILLFIEGRNDDSNQKVPPARKLGNRQLDGA